NTGRWSFEGSNLASVPAFKVSRKGMVRTFQLTKSLGRLSVLQNMLLGARDQKGENIFRALIPSFWRSQEKANTERADDLLRRFKLDAKR
ncbi:ABC transporter ATP-binding protein, partial [Escherichia coli]